MLADARRRDPAACRALVLCYQDRVFGLLRRLTIGRAADAILEDLAQETFVRTFEHLDRFDPKCARLSTWILTIATRLAIDELRRNLRRPDALPLDDEAIAATTIEQTLEHRGLAIRIANAVADLPDGQRAVFVLRVYHGLEYAEIAEILDIDESTVGSRLSRARSLLCRIVEVDHDIRA